MSIEPLDFFDRRSLLSDEQRLAQETVARFVDREVVPIIGRCFVDHRPPLELVPRLAELGLLGATVRSHGGSGVDSITYGLICEELERGDSSLRSFVSVQNSLVAGCIEAFGSDAQRQRWLPQLVRGTAIGCFGLTEPEGGSDPARMQTKAERRGGDWSVHGSKRWITNGTIADVAIVWARRPEGVGAFLIERGTAGFAAHEIADKLSLRASSTAELALDEVVVPEENRLPGAEGLGAALACLDRARFGIAWGALGAARACLAEALDYTRGRQMFGRPLAETQLMQARLADAARRLTAAQLIARRLAELKEAGVCSSAQISLAKWNNVRMALDVARDCRDILGAAGITADHCAVRHMLNLESVITYEGTETIHELVVGRALTGEAAF